MKRKKKEIIQETRVILQWMCPYCGLPNEAAAQNCIHCDAVRPEKPRWRNVSAEASGIVRREQKEKEEPWKAGLFVVLVMLFIAPLTASCVMHVFSKIPHKTDSYGSWWQCDIYLEEYGLIQQSGPELPEGATLISTATITSHKLDRDGDPTGEVETEISYYYECEGWGEGRVITTKGNPNTIPYYGEVELGENEREKERTTTYYVIFTAKDESVTLPVSEHQYKQIEEVGYIKYTRDRQVQGENAYTILN